MKRILIVYHHRFSPRMRETIRQHIFCFRDAEQCQCYFLNAAFGIPNYLHQLKIDWVIFQPNLLCFMRYSGETYERWAERLRELKNIGRIRVMLPQDEFIQTDWLCRFAQDFGVRAVFSVATPHDLQQIYSGLIGDPIQFFHVLTGYLDVHTIKTARKLSTEVIGRTVDIGYRAWHAEYWLGRHGMLKTTIADRFQKAGLTRHVKLDISTDEGATFLGLDWYRFLLRCKYTIGVEGGSSLFDYDGSIKAKARQFLALNPQASFEETERACFPGLDGKLAYFSISPRHLEACITKTCQILIEGDYNGILKPWRHYIPLKRDFSNLDQILDLVERDELRLEMVETAYQDIVMSGHYTHKTLVRTVIHCCQEIDQELVKGSTFQGYDYWHMIRDRWIRCWVTIEGFCWQRAKKHLPSKFTQWLKVYLKPLIT